MESPNTNTLERIYQILDSIEPDEYGCRNWPGTFGKHGLVSIKGKRFKVHRLALERKLDRPIRPGFLACHTCDWPPCINQDHLYEGTKKTNAQDRVSRHPETWDHVRNPNSPQMLKLRNWSRSKENSEHWGKVQPMGIKARWNRDTNIKK